MKRAASTDAAFFYTQSFLLTDPFPRVILDAVKKSLLSRTASLMGGFLAISFALGVATVPGLYLLTWAFRRVLIDAVFTGSIPSLWELLFFGFFLGVALSLFVLSLALILSLGNRVLSLLFRQNRHSGAVQNLLKNTLKLLPGAEVFFRRLARLDPPSSSTGPLL